MFPDVDEHVQEEEVGPVEKNMETEVVAEEEVEEQVEVVDEVNVP